jgi:V/A-type H+-transporting ATPase subunit A
MAQDKSGTIIKVSGPLVVAEGMTDASMYDVVRVGEMSLVGEVIELREDRASIQVYEETTGIGVGDPVYSTGGPLSVELAPGLIESIYDGIQRPLDIVLHMTGDRIERGVEASGISREKKWRFQPTAVVGDRVAGGDILGTVQETTLVSHKIMVPPGLSGVVQDISSGDFTVVDAIARIKKDDGTSQEIAMLQKWPVRRGRPYSEKLPPNVPLVTGQRVIDTFFPIAMGGVACVPGPFGSGKTVVLHQFAKWADAQIVVYIGCGERGNEMTDVLLEFPHLKDPKSGEPLMKRTVLIANTSNMPVAAREASVYTGITIGEYFRDMGYSVALMADSTSRWAEAMREISGRLEEMPGEEGYPAYLGSRVAAFYERGGRVAALGSDRRIGALSIMGAVSPPGGDLSEPVVQATLRMVKVFWSLEARLAYARHFPAIDWLRSYSLYLDNIGDHLNGTVAKDWMETRREAMRLLQEEAQLQEIVRLVGADSLSPNEQLVLETARSIREDFLHQNAFDEIDTYTTPDKQYRMIRLILKLHHLAGEAIKNNVPIRDILNMSVRDDIGRAKMIPEGDISRFDEIERKMEEDFKALATAGSPA